MYALAATSTRNKVLRTPTTMFDALKDIVTAVKELDLGVGGFFALCFMAIFVWGAKRSSEFANGLSGEWKRLIDEGVAVRDSLKKELADTKQASSEKDALIEDLRRDYASLYRKYYQLAEELKQLKRELP